MRLPSDVTSYFFYGEPKKVKQFGDFRQHNIYNFEDSTVAISKERYTVNHRRHNTGWQMYYRFEEHDAKKID